MRFCLGCGHRLDDATATPERDPRSYTPKHLADKILQSKSALGGERKQVTVLFADVKGSMELSQELDPETWHQILERFFGILTDGVHRFEGTVNQYTGDGIMALFGAPIAHEDHAQQACHAALELQDALGRFTEEARRDHGVVFSTRIGLNSGEVVVGRIGDDLRMDYTAQGHTVGLAQRIETLAHPGRPCVSEATAKLVEGFFELEDQGEFRVKGVRDRIRIHGLLGVGRARTRVDRAPGVTLSRFVGRGDEMAVLEAAFRETSAGRGQIVGLVADAGLGKSRLAKEFLQRVRATGAQVVETHCPSHGKQVPLLMYLQCVRRIYDIDDRDDPETARGKIESRFRDWFPELVDEMPLVFDFLGVPDPSRPLPPMTAEERQRRLTQWARRAMAARGQRMCFVFLFEDMHWVDPASEGLLGAVIQGTPGIRQMVLLTYRPEYTPPWVSKSFYRQVPLLPLAESAMHDLLEALLGPDLAGSALAERIRDRGMGTPFFVEELIHSLAERGLLEGERGAFRLARPVEEIPLPSTVQAVLAARIDRLPEREKQLLQTAAVLGKEFSEPVLNRISPLARAEQSESIAALVRAEFLYEKALYPEVEYAFKHPLTQDVAYQSQLSDRRRTTHAAVARALEEVGADRLDERAALIAHHWAEAGEGLEAARWYRRAAEWMSVRDVGEAFSLWRSLCSVLEGVAESRERSELRLTALLQILNLALRLGLSLDEAASDFTEARELATALDDPWSLGLAFNTYSVLLTFEARLSESLEHCQEASRSADRTDDVGLRLLARMDEAHTLFQLGQLERAMEVCESALSETPEDVTVGRAIRGFSPYIQLVSFRGQFATLLGQLPEARRDLERSLELALEHDEVELPGWNHFRLADWACFAGDPAGGLRHARSALENAEQTGSRLTAALGYRCLGNAHIARGAWDDAVDALEGSLRITREEGVAKVEQPIILAWLADAYLGTGAAERALETASEAIEMSRRMGTRWKEIAGHLSRARALRTRGAREAPEVVTAALRAAEDLVTETGARVYLPHLCEERAALAALLGDQADQERHLLEAHRLYMEMGAAGHAERLAGGLGS